MLLTLNLFLQISVNLMSLKESVILVLIYTFLFINGGYLFPGGSNKKGKESACNAGDLGLILGGGHGNSLQYSCLENPHEQGAWRSTVHRVAKSRS